MTRVVIVNTSSNTGGAAIAAKRLLIALNKQPKIEAKMLVRDGNATQNIIITTNSRWKKFLNFVRFAWERFIFVLLEKSKEVRFLFSLANTGEDIAEQPVIKNADIIHLHWINGGFLSLKSIKKLLQLNKPIVWTLHDMWLFTGGCHHSGECNNFMQQCGNCNFIKFPVSRDISHRIWKRKEKIFKQSANIIVVTCSSWLRGKAMESSLLANKCIVSIPNPIDTEVFKPIDKILCREKLDISETKKYILFAAANVNNYFKGFSYFTDSLQLLLHDHPDIKDKIEILVVGRIKNKEIFTSIPLSYRVLGTANEEKMILIYNACDIYVTSSLQENLPNTIMEAFACGTPVVGFNIGGIPEMIDHRKNGWLATFKSADSLAEGIYWTLFEADSSQLSANARDKAMKEYNEDRIAREYLNLYQQLLAK
jgi:glycosyltransferase involved in cell wall biosynthesis